jgi:hypothetical protein
MYCVTELPARAGSASALKLSFRPLEPWEKGHNVVLVSAAGVDALRALGEALPFDAEELSEAVADGKAVPIARVGTAAEAEALAARASEASVEVRVVSDDALKSETAPVRLRWLEFGDGLLTASLFNTDELVEVSAADIRLIVAGNVVSSVADTVETKKSRKPGKVEATESSSDEFVIDVYAGDDALGWRIPGRGFDYSCLGEEKTLAAGENGKRLVERLLESCTAAKVDRNYEKVRDLLDAVWPPDAERGSAAFNRKGFGGVEVAKRTVYDRTRQFTRYSRMLRALL